MRRNAAVPVGLVMSARRDLRLMHVETDNPFVK
jgi:hypothetical protein